MQIITLDGRRMTDRRQTHRYLAMALRFPVYYGRNLDALADCLGEFCGNTILVLRNAEAMRQSLGEYGDRLIGVFSDVAKTSGLRFFIDPD